VGLPSTSSRLRSLIREQPDHFALFSLERRFPLDEAALERSYLELSRLLHPDRQVALKSDEPLARRQARALALSASMNQAYATLKDPTKRAEYLLKLLGGKTADQDKRTPQDFLAEMLELREEVETAEPARLASLLAALEDRAKEAFARLEGLFEAKDAPGIRLELNALKYVTNLIEELRAKVRA
jgi:molecular chaperone HscB